LLINSVAKLEGSTTVIPNPTTGQDPKPVPATSSHQKFENSSLPPNRLSGNKTRNTVTVNT